ncbi:MAG: 30S ribosomal protein S1 [Clostridia bacterium]|nr:30S ribosomal protein S1 [Clostridia bacterium]
MNLYTPEGRLINTPENRKWLASPLALTEAKSKEIILEATALMCDSEHNLTVDLGCMKGIIKRNDGALGIEEGRIRDIALISRVGKPLSFTVEQIKTDASGKFYAELSRKKAQQKCIDEYLNLKSPGSVIDAKITHLESFGAFCDIGCGIIALLPIDAISVSRISHPSDRFSVGDNIKAIIKSIDDSSRFTLSHKELLGTWEENVALFREGQTVTGIIRSVENYGVFVELAPNLAGLAEPKAGAQAGMLASVYIKSIIPEKMKVKLIIIDTFEGDNTNPLKYYPTEEKISKWYYSPLASVKNIYTDFLNQ